MTDAEAERYSRQTLFSPIGPVGQQRLTEAHVVIVGCGALGTFQAAALARAGVGRLTIIDRDYVEPSNLQRQWLFTEADAEASAPKAVAAKRALGAINSAICVEARVADLHGGNATELLGEPDLILDGADNFETRYLVNDYAVHGELPWIYGAAVGSHGVTMPVIPHRTACLRCLFPEPPGAGAATCDTAGVLGAITASIAAQQVADALRLLVAGADALTARLLEIDVWYDTRRTISTAELDPACPACGKGEFPFLEPRVRHGGWLCGRDAVQLPERERPVDLAGLAARLAPLGRVRVSEYLVRFQRAPHELTVFADGRAIVKGTSDLGVARSLYARFVGS